MSFESFFYVFSCKIYDKLKLFSSSIWEFPNISVLLISLNIYIYTYFTYIHMYTYFFMCKRPITKLYNFHKLCLWHRLKDGHQSLLLGFLFTVQSRIPNKELKEFIETEVPGKQLSGRGSWQRGGIKYFILEKFLLQAPNVSTINVTDVTRERCSNRRTPIGQWDSGLLERAEKWSPHE